MASSSSSKATISQIHSGVSTMLQGLSHGTEYRTHKKNFYTHFSPRFSLLEPFDGGMAGSSTSNSPAGSIPSPAPTVGAPAGIKTTSQPTSRTVSSSSVPTIGAFVDGEMAEIEKDQQQFYRLLSQYATAKKSLLSGINTMMNSESNQYKGRLIREPTTDTTFYVNRFGIVRPFTSGSVSNMDSTCSNLGMSPDISGTIQDFVKQHNFTIGNAMASGEPCGLEGQNVQAFTASYVFNAGGGKPDLCADTPDNSNMILTGQSCGVNADGSINMLWNSIKVLNPAQRCANS